ncbi:hypothetical protein FQA39_LY04009 [Lamprigera yunnana]|nr:hypothetical protein FQA39_LY04009 [Lamprigera yunnana]
MTFQKLLEQTITFTVFRPRVLVIPQKIIGSIKLDVATVWAFENHQCYKKWAAIIPSPKDVEMHPKGYLQVSIGVIKKGEKFEIPTVAGDTDEIEGNLLQLGDATIERQKANYVFQIYYAVLLSKGKQLDAKYPTHPEKDQPSAYVEISFAGLKGRTSVKKVLTNPTWNECVTIPYYFPPLYQGIKINVYQSETGFDSIIATRSIDLQSISCSGEKGFLPTFGPAYVHFYRTCNKNEAYVGKILMSFKMVLHGSKVDMLEKVTVKSTPSILEKNMWTLKSILLCGIIFNCNLVPKKYSEKPISFELSLGHGPKFKTKELPHITDPQEPTTKDKKYWCIEYGNKKPCFYSRSRWPDLRSSLYLQNKIFEIIDALKELLAEIEDALRKPFGSKFQDELEELYATAFRFISHACKSFVKQYESETVVFETLLGQNRRLMRIRDLVSYQKFFEVNSECFFQNEISQTATTVKIHNTNCYKTLYSMCHKLERLAVEEECWPDIYVTCISGDKKVAFAKFAPRLLVHSGNHSNKGRLCGKIQSVFLESARSEENASLPVACRLDLMLWIGLEEEREEFFKTIPSCFAPVMKYSNDVYPLHVQADEYHEVDCKVYVYQGKFWFGHDKSGLSDPFMRIIVNNQCKESEVSQATLNPLWDQTITFSKLTLYGSKKHIKSNPPPITVEVYDQDYFSAEEYLGRCAFSPVVKLSGRHSPKLIWRKVISDAKVVGEVMIAAEILKASEKIESSKKSHRDIVRIPSEIKPAMTKYRIEVLFWGVRDLHKVNFTDIYRPRATLECVYATINSEVVHVVRGQLNFSNCYKTMDLNLPADVDCIPPLCMKLSECRSFGRNIFVGIQLFDMFPFIFQPITLADKVKYFGEKDVLMFDTSKYFREFFPLIFYDLLGTVANTASETTSSAKNRWYYRIKKKFTIGKKRKRYRKSPFKFRSIFLKDDILNSIDVERNEQVRERRMKTSRQLKQSGKTKKAHKCPFLIRIIYPSELENQPEFGKFQDSLHIFRMCKHKSTGDELVDEHNVKATLKASIQIYRIPLDSEENYLTPYGHPLSQGVYSHFFLNEPTEFLVRIYCVRAINLRPKDVNGKSDPYLYVLMGKQKVKDVENYVPKQVNPIFGRYFEFKGVFPQDHLLRIQVWDYDRVTKDDLIGETNIDIENRFYTRYRARCGLAKHYNLKGYCQWRDYQTPTQILKDLCKMYNLKRPEYKSNSVQIGTKVFSPLASYSKSNVKINKESLALHVLRKWRNVPYFGFKFVPEHVETRSLYHYSDPGIEQGKLQLWIDIFPSTEVELPKPINIAPRKAVTYELRVILWNTEEVILQEDDFFVGERMSDIYVKAWLVSSKNNQYTDIHYRSMTGEGNFNWRFVFRFKYLSVENVIVINKKDSLFSRDETEFKLPCKLTLEVWDNDTISADDFLGSVTLELAKMPRGAPRIELCTLENLKKSAPHINLFKLRRARGWWPFRAVDEETDAEFLGGKAEMEFELLTEEEADRDPVGLGRSNPKALSMPM